MFKLTFSPVSPYVRKVLLSAYRTGIQAELELVKYEPDAKTKEAQQHFLKLWGISVDGKTNLDN